MRAEQIGHDAEERAWATDVARAFLAPATAMGTPTRAAEDAPLAGTVLVVGVVPLPASAPEARDDEQEGRTGGHLE